MEKKTEINGLEIYNANLEALRQQYPLLAEKVEKCKVNNDFEMRATGAKRYINLYCKEKDCYYYDEENPLEDVKSEIEKLDLKNAKIAIMLGFGMGYELDVYGKHYSEKSGTKYIIVIEKELEIFKTALHMFDYTPMINNPLIQLFIGEDEKELFGHFLKYFQKNLRIGYLKAIKSVFHRSALQINKDYYLNAIKIIKESGLYAVRFYGNSPEDSMIGLENILKNVEEIVANPGIKHLFDKFKGKPAVVVSTGPSLNKNKHLLKELEGKALIVSCDASLRVLMDMDVKPHLVTTLERFPLIIPLFEGFEKEQVKDVYLAGCPVIDNGVFKTYPGPKIIVYRDFEHFKWVEVDKGILEIKQSSGNMAFKVAAALGCNPIILIGQDLAYSRDGKTHADGNVFGAIQEEYVTGDYLQRQLEVMGNDGKMILTNEDWNDFKKGYETDLLQYEGLCINSTEGGAYINGTQVMTFREAIDKYIKGDFNAIKIIEESLKEFTNVDEEKDITTLKNVIELTKKDIEIIKNHCLDAHNIINEKKEIMTELLNRSEDKYTDIEIKEVEDFSNAVFGNRHKIIKVEPTMQKFVMHIFQPYFIKFEMDLNEQASLYEGIKQKIYVNLLHQSWFAVLHDIINICIFHLDEAYAKIVNMKLGEKVDV